MLIPHTGFTEICFTRPHTKSETFNIVVIEKIKPKAQHCTFLKKFNIKFVLILCGHHKACL